MMTATQCLRASVPITTRVCSSYRTRVRSSYLTQRRRRLKSWRGQEFAIFRQTDSWKFPTEEIMGTQNSNFAITFSQKG